MSANKSSRKRHSKSRNGCQNCKKRHVKCDEQGPPCLNCVMRREQNACIYPFLRQHHHAPTITPPTIPSPSSFSSSATSDNNRILELELMHRWSTHSWTCQATTPDCRDYMLDYLPRAALRNGYLLSAILATAAVDLAVSHNTGSVSNSYVRAALEYGTRAMAEFRAQVSALTPENIDLVFYFSGLVGMVQFALPASPLSESSERMDGRASTRVIDRACDHADATLKSGRAVFEHLPWLLNGPSPAGRIVRDFPMELKFMDVLDTSTKAALDLMSAVSRRVRVSASSPTVRESVLLTGEVVSVKATENVVSGKQSPLACEVMVYKLAIGQTKYAFAEDQQDRLKGYFHTVFAVAGSSFAAAVRDREPMAVFIIMYWGVLVQRATRNPELWGLVSEGREVVAEASEFLVRSGIAEVPGVRQGIAWTRKEVGLAPLPGCPLPATLHGSGIDKTVSEDFLESWRSELALLLHPDEGTLRNHDSSEPGRGLGQDEL